MFARSRIDRAAGGPAPAVALTNATRSAGAPEFKIQADAGVDRIWWQIATDEEFASIAPNFDCLTAPAEKLAFDPLTATFFNADQPYFVRLKARRDGVWGKWTPPLSFTVAKPARPAPVSSTAVRGKLRLTWPGAGSSAEYLVFGSNRRDFLPEVFSTEEIVTMREQGIEQTRPNKNLIATVATPEIEFTPGFQFYRIITRREEALSVPSEIIVTPRELASSLPAPTILQTRWSRVPDSAATNGYRDIHVTAETPLPR